MRVLELKDLPPPPPGKLGWPWTDAPARLPERAPDGGAWPAIGIVTPSFNQGEYLEATIRSVLLQGYPNLEYFIEDGGSSDISTEIIRKYAPFISGWTSEKDRGQAHAINKGMARLANAEWVNWLNSDDQFLPGALAAAGARAAAPGEAVLVIGNGRRTYAGSGKVMEIPRSSEIGRETVRLWHLHNFLQPAALFSKRAFDAAGALDESLRYAMDFCLWVKLGERGPFELIDAPLALEVRHAGAKTTDAMGEHYAEACAVLFRLGYEKEARKIVSNLYENFEYMSRVTRPITENPIYRNWVRPWIRRRYGPPHLK